MFVKFTNANEKMAGQPVIINVAVLNSIYAMEREGQMITMLCTPNDLQSWAVMETLDEVFAMIKDYRIAL
jgi:hypothetical protein